MLDLGDVIAGYRIDETVDTGPLGATYRATQIALGRPVFLHVVSPPLSNDPSFRDEYLDAARRAAALDHPSILPVHESGDQGGYLFLTSAHVDGRTLAQIVAEDGPLSPHRAARIVAQVADGLEAAHAAGLVHGEFTSSSVLVASREGEDHAYVVGLGVPAPRGTSSVDDVGALGVVLAEAVANSDGVVGEVVSGEYPSAAAFGQAARTIAEPAPAQRPRRSYAIVAVAVALAVLVGALAALATTLARSGSDSSSSIAGTVSGEPIAVGTKPFLLKIANGSVWAQTESGSLVQVDPTRGAPIGLPISEPDLTAWAFSDDELLVARAAGDVIRLDPRSHRRIGDTIDVGKTPYALAVVGDSLWASNVSSDFDETTIAEFDLATGARQGTPVELPAFAPVLIVAEGAIWAGQFLGDLGVLARIDPTTHRVVANIAVGRSPSGLASGGGSLWVSNRTVGSVMRVDTDRNEVAWTRSVAGVIDVTYADGSVWALTRDTVVRLDPESGYRLGEPVVLPSPGERIAAEEGAVWVLSYDAGDLTRIQVADEAPAPAPGQLLEESPPTFPVEGPLRPGRYSTEAFGIPLSLSVDEGWSLIDSERGAALALVRASNPRNSLFFEIVPRVFADGSTLLQPAPANLVQWFRNHPHLTIRRSRTTTIGGRRAVVMDVAVTSTPKPNPPECGPTPCVLLFKDAPNSEFVLSPPPGEAAGPNAPARDRFVFVEVGGETLTIGYGTYGPVDMFKAFAPEAEKLLSSIEFR